MKIEEITTDEYNVHVINSIKQKYPELRQKSKSPTFALTYQGTAYTLQKNLGFSEEEAKQVEASYHELYKVSDQWVKSKLEQAQKDGYVTCAFGLKLRTPLLKKAIMGTKQTLKEAEAEGRTAGNALGQYAKDILPVAQIHDALYFFIRDNLDIIVWFNKILIKAMEWQEDPAIAHDKVKLGGDLEIFFPDWAHPIEVPNNATKEDIIRILKNEKSNK